jgi:hypothetical protein
VVVQSARAAKRKEAGQWTDARHRLGDVLQLRPHVGEADIDLAADLPLRVIRYADPAGLRARF